jgi:hypothetical protein
MPSIEDDRMWSDNQAVAGSLTHVLGDSLCMHHGVLVVQPNSGSYAVHHRFIVTPRADTA